MVRFIAIFISLTIFLQASILKDKCFSCHQKQSIPFKMIYKRYLIKYSSHNAIKEAMIKMCKNPTIKQSVIPRAFLKRVGLKKPCNLTDKELSNAVDEFINFYDVKKNIKIRFFDKNF